MMSGSVVRQGLGATRPMSPGTVPLRRWREPDAADCRAPGATRSPSRQSGPPPPRSPPCPRTSPAPARRASRGRRSDRSDRDVQFPLEDPTVLHAHHDARRCHLPGGREALTRGWDLTDQIDQPLATHLLQPGSGLWAGLAECFPNGTSQVMDSRVIASSWTTCTRAARAHRRSSANLGAAKSAGTRSPQSRVVATV